MADRPKQPREPVSRPDLGGPFPEHIAVIMDGNGRWAQERGLRRIFGHREGIASVSHNLANVALALGEHEKAIQLTSDARSIALELGFASLAASSEKVLEKLRRKIGEDAYRKLEGDLIPPGGP